MNEFLIGVRGNDIVFLKPVPQKLTKEQAITLAAWIVALADDYPGEKQSDFATKLEAVLNEEYPLRLRREERK